MPVIWSQDQEKDCSVYRVCIRAAAREARECLIHRITEQPIFIDRFLRSAFASPSSRFLHRIAISLAFQFQTIAPEQIINRFYITPTPITFMFNAVLLPAIL